MLAAMHDLTLGGPVRVAAAAAVGRAGRRTGRAGGSADGAADRGALRRAGAGRRRRRDSRPRLRHTRRVARAAIVTIGNELVSGDVENTNGSWLARRLAGLGVEVVLIAVHPGRDRARSPRSCASRPRQSTSCSSPAGSAARPTTSRARRSRRRSASPQVEQPDVAARLRARFTRDPEYAARWALLPEGSRPLENPLGGAPGFAIGNVYVLPGLPAEMEAMFETIADELRAGDADRLLAAHLPDDGEPDRLRARGDRPSVIPGCSSARTRASTPRGARSRSWSSRPTRSRWRRRPRGSRPLSSEVTG